MRATRAAAVLAIALLVWGCAASPSTPAAASPGLGTSRTVAARLAPNGATAPIDDAAWALADRLTAASYTADNTSAMVAALARAGIATYSDPSSVTPEAPLTAAASPLQLLDFQTHALAVGIWTGATWSGAELDRVVPVPAGNTTIASASVLLASYVAAVDSPGAALARAVMAGQDLLDPPTVRFPALVLVLFASDLGTAGGQVAAPSPSPSAAALDTSREIASVANPADGRGFVLPADPVGGICSNAANWLQSKIDALFDALKLAEPSNPFGKIFATIWNFAVTVLQKFAEGLITTVTGAVLDGIRSIAATISGVAEEIVSFLPYGVDVEVSGGSNAAFNGADFTLGDGPLPGAYVATITAADIPKWPAILQDCANVAKIALPDFSSKNVPITWGPIAIEPAGGALLAGNKPGQVADQTDSTGVATWAFTVSPDPGKTGEDRTQSDEMPVTAHRPELDKLRNALTNALLGFVPQLLRNFVKQEILQPTVEKLQDNVNPILDARGTGYAFLHYHDQATPKPSSAAASDGTASCSVSLPAGTYSGTFTGDTTTIEPPGQIDLGESGGENSHSTGPLTVIVAPNGTLGGTFQWTTMDHMVFQGPAVGTIDKTIQLQGAGISGTLCNLTMTFASEVETTCTATGEPQKLGMCGSAGKTIPLSGLVPPLPLGAPTSVGGGTLTWSFSHENGVDLGFGGLSAELQTTYTVTLKGP